MTQLYGFGYIFAIPNIIFVFLSKLVHIFFVFLINKWYTFNMILGLHARQLLC